MIKCPACNSNMVYREGEGNFGHYEFYGCSTYPACKQTVKLEDAYKYDDGKKPPKRSIEEEAEDLARILRRNGYSREDAEYAKYKWEKEE